MALWKYVSIVAIILAVTVNAVNFPYDPAFSKYFMKKQLLNGIPPYILSCFVYIFS